MTKFVWANELKPCSEMIRLLHPTQKAFGAREVAARSQKIRKLMKKNPLELDKLMREKAIEIVRGPKNIIYVVDHHHHALACWQAGLEAVYIRELADFSNLSEENFWKEMLKRSWLYLFDEEGKPIEVSEIKKLLDLHSMKDDPYRSLAADVRDEGGFNKTSTPFMEFRWANFFRTRLPLGSTEKEYKNALKKAIKLARSKEARELPGYKGD